MRSLNGFQVGRMITPYGGYMAQGQYGFSNAWTHEYSWDITDFAPLLDGFYSN